MNLSLNAAINTHQVIIIGGGVVGGLAALLLAQEGVDVTVLDAAPQPNDEHVQAQLNPRVLALNSASLRLMHIAGVWQHVLRHQPYSAMQVINRDDHGELFFGQPSEHIPMRQDWLGSMVEPSVLTAAINRQLEQAQIDVRYNSRASRLEQLPHGWQVTLASGEKLVSSLIIGADGAQSWVRQQAHIELERLDYHQIALTAAIRTTQPHAYTARQIFLPSGPLALLPMVSLNPLQNGYWQSLVWTLPHDDAMEYAALPDAEFADTLTHASHHLLGEVVDVQSRAHFPLQARHARHYVRDGLALIGDAAHVIHPLAGQGVNLGCLDAAVLTDCLLTDDKRGVWAHKSTLQRYEHLRRGHNSMMMHSMSALGWLNQTQLRPMMQLRNQGIRFAAQRPTLLEFFNTFASGLSHLANTRYATVAD